MKFSTNVSLVDLDLSRLRIAAFAHTLLLPGLLRRTKATKAEDLELPPRLVTLRPIRLHPIEEDFYNALYTQTKASFDDYVAEGTLLNNYAHIFVSAVVLSSCSWWLARPNPLINWRCFSLS